MQFSLIICTYCRAYSINRLLNSIKEQTNYPFEIIIVDSSPGQETELMLKEEYYERVQYYKVGEKDRGLTKQRNFGIKTAHKDSEILCFLDDDIVLKPNYFEQLITTFSIYPEAVGVGGAIINDDVWVKIQPREPKKFEKYYFKEWERKLGSRNVLRKKLGLLSDKPPGVMPTFSNGFSIGFYPLTGEIHKVEYFMGGVSGFKKELFNEIKFSEYFQGYGLYEDMDFCLRATKIGQLFLNTDAQVYHLHEEAGRPDHFKYGKMVVENGWVVWKLKNPSPNFPAVFKWNLIILLLSIIRIKNALIDKESGAFKDAMGRLFAWVKLGFIKPKYEF